MLQAHKKEEKTKRALTTPGSEFFDDPHAV
jgi:hypothetical protein